MQVDSSFKKIYFVPGCKSKVIYTYIALHYDVRLHAIQASFIEAGF